MPSGQSSTPAISPHSNRLRTRSHRWKIDAGEAIALQRKLADQIDRTGTPHPVQFVAGIDCAFSRDGTHCLAAVIVWDVSKAVVVEERVARRAVTFPYIPGLLSFREGPAILTALRRVETKLDLLIFDGQGIAHPRRLGLACHIGWLADLPAIGCAKSRLVGKHREPGLKRGCRTALNNRGERIGTVLRTRDGVRPLYVSTGHRIHLSEAEKWVLRLATKVRLPEPVRRADRKVAEVRKGT